MAKAKSFGLEVVRTNFEKSEGHKIVWANDINQAIELVRTADPKEDDGKIIRARDLLLLETVKAKLLN